MIHVSTPVRKFLAPLAACAFALAAPGSAARAQHDAGEHGEHSEHAMSEHAMSGHLDMSAHMVMTPPRAPTGADSARAREVAATLRAAIAKYSDVRAAEADGYKQFAPQIKNQRVYHFTSNRAAIKAAFTFDPERPTSLLYRRAADGSLRLIGAMYTAPRRASLDDLDARVPLSVARWHKHVNICVPPRGAAGRWRETENGQMRFGPAGAIATRERCDAVGGRFIPQLFGWMVHANVMEGDDLATVWGGGH